MKLPGLRIGPQAWSLGLRWRRQLRLRLHSRLRLPKIRRPASTSIFCVKLKTAHQAQKWEEAAPTLGARRRNEPDSGLVLVPARHGLVERIRTAKGQFRLWEKARELGAGSINIKPAYDVARAFATLGEKDSTLAWLQLALDDGFRSREKMRTEEAFQFIPRGRALQRTCRRRRHIQDVARRGMAAHDLTFLETEIKRMHYAPFRNVSQADLRRGGPAASGRRPQLVRQPSDCAPHSMDE
jgi:hypothetical protein